MNGAVTAVFALAMVACHSATEPAPPSPSGQPLNMNDAATSPSPDAGVGTSGTPDPSVRELVDETCSTETLRCPDGRGCVNLQAFGIYPWVCFKPGKTEADIECPPGTRITTFGFDAVPSWRCSTE